MNVKKTAIHEAGHAVAHVRLGISHDGANIIPEFKDGVWQAGAAIGEGVQHVWSAAEAEPMVLAFCAGYAALIAAGYPPGLAATGADDDFDQAQELIDYWGLHTTLDDFKARAVELMQQPRNVEAVAFVARHLLDRRRLDGDHLGVLIEVSDGVTTEADLQRYLTMRGL